MGVFFQARKIICAFAGHREEAQEAWTGCFGLWYSISEVLESLSRGAAVQILESRKGRVESFLLTGETIIPLSEGKRVLYEFA